MISNGNFFIFILFVGLDEKAVSFAGITSE